MKTNYIDITGKKFGFITVLGHSNIRIKHRLLWNCKCVCGKIIKRIRGVLNVIQSCGCMKAYIQSKKGTRHGMHGSRTYTTWQSIKTRCSCRSYPSYYRYGGRGIFVCDRWLHSFENFLKDMGERPEGCSIERIDNDRHYEPGNCRWVTRKGETKCLSDWAEHVGIKRETVKARIKYGWSIEEALSTPIIDRRSLARSRKRDNGRFCPVP